MNSTLAPEAHQSNAGDDFHILWTTRRSFNLLSFDERGIKAIIIEGPLVEEPDELDFTRGSLLVIDIAEYFGHEGFE